ncbi:MAG: DMT family transporter [Planctomycetota bacterium]|nr:DMT family transporter [Planctomycetota bacterium]
MSRTASTLPHHVALAVTQVCFGLFPLIGKIAFSGGFTPGAVAIWRIASGAVVLGIIACMLHGKRAIPPRRAVLRIQIASLLGIALNQLCFLEGLKRAPIANAGLMIGLIPALTYGVALIARQERMHKGRVMGIAIGILAIGQLLVQEGGTHLLGDLLLLSNMLAYSVYLVVSRPLAKEFPPIATAAWMFLFSTWTLPLLAWDADVAPIEAPAAAWWALGFVIVFPTSLGYLLNLYAMTRLTASTAAVYTFSQPALVIFTGVMRGDPITPANSIAAIGVFAAMWLVLRGRPTPGAPGSSGRPGSPATPSDEQTGSNPRT